MLNLRRKGGVIPDVFGSAAGPRALVSALDRPFRKGLHLKHNNLQEAMEMARVLDELGYRVDVVNNDSPAAVDYDRYGLVLGWGQPLDGLFRREAPRRPVAILYRCGAYLPFSNGASLDRLEAVRRRRGVWLAGSARLADAGIGCERAVDGLVVLGNAVTAGRYRAATPKPVFELPLFFHRMLDPQAVLRDRDRTRARNHFVWFAGSGLVHKGLDLVLEAFARNPELHLHVYGDLDGEPGFLAAFRRELEAPNVHVEGFLALDSPRFREALLASAFMICPSCAEACNSSVLNICGNGGNVPVVTRECGIDLGDFGIPVADTTVAAVAAALAAAAALDDAELDRRLRATAAHMAREHSLEHYHARLKAAVQAILAAQADGAGQEGRNP